MKVIIYSAQEHEKKYLNEANRGQHSIFFETKALSLNTVEKAKGYQAVSCFISDCLDRAVIEKLSLLGIRLIVLRSAGYDHVDLTAAKSAEIAVARAPKYSPQAVAEFACALTLALSREILKSYENGKKHNFSLEGLMGFNLYEKTIGIIGTGNIGIAFARIMRGFGCRLLAYDPIANDLGQKLGIQYVSLEKLFRESDIVSLHCPLNESTHHMINEKAFSQIKKGAMLINTGRGGLVDTEELIRALELGQLRFVGLDVYEKEKGLFFKDHSGKAVDDELFLKLQARPNVLITPHQAFLTKEAVSGIAETTIDNMTAFEKGKPINII
jgi:D-lactate dehydrogenase